ncbi:Uncharacterized protein C1F12.08 [Taphrina deformans PYCC 5710]|uniref:Uncharacterized protein C1F12.08 n=1 Tax=Taphrina deformans (strain PYCC 5710 / ATCC 11124 / CBS 356.35 / IMI 108563 / JCM 9778 / NBRC 8474) TaxID=1097556 RepID=R4X8P1_TAPDE|nr:Uncharacterized protein C1F12.08 [Taphrina deformans PYCC 5710]|eukprot:CCG81750.1 Uncharacterized protein C1F12.08 [Taphrina deformans PYCC 5710]
MSSKSKHSDAPIIADTLSNVDDSTATTSPDRTLEADRSESTGFDLTNTGITSVVEERTAKALDPRVKRSLVLATLRQPVFSITNFSSLLKDVIRFSADRSITTLDILLFTTDEVSHVWAGFSSDAFLQVQKTISELYIETARISRELKSNLETTIIFADWSGYDLAKEDLDWAVVGVNTIDRALADNFLNVHQGHYKDRINPVVIESSATITRESTTTSLDNPPRIYNVVAVGGTFDHLHAGHKILLTMTAWLAQGKVVCGITGDALLVNKKHKEVMENIVVRTQHVDEFYHRLKRGITYELVPIEDVAGPTGTDPTIQALIASRETEAGSAQIREIRQNKNLPPLDILFIDVIGPEGEVHGAQMAELKLSSTAIRQRLASKI